MLKEIIASTVMAGTLVASSLFAQVTHSFLPVRVHRILDGDTLEVKYGRRIHRIRLACIDAPELKQEPHGRRSREQLSGYIPVGAKIVLKTFDTDNYGRRIAEVYAGNTNVNQTMVADGMAAVYRDYLNTCNSNRSQYLDFELYAQENKFGIWSDPNFIVPWEFRRK